MRIAVLIRERCQPKKCVYECQNYCPPVRTGTETIVMGEDGRPVVSEELCVGCGICVHKCPFEAIKIVSLPDEMKERVVHQYGMNGFTLFGLPSPQESRVVGIIGANGIGKTTAVKILSGEVIPNLGEYDEESSWNDVIENFAGTELRDYFKRLADGKLKVSIKPQYVDNIPKVHKGEVRTLLERMDTDGMLGSLAESLEMGRSLDQKLEKLSGGELQRVAIVATLLKDADIYFLDEPSSYLDVKQRMEVAKVLQDVVKEKKIVVVEHDLAILTYLNGYLKEENVRFRGYPIKFEVKSPKESWLSAPLVEYGNMSKRFRNFKLEVKGGRIKKGEVVGVLGPNATGKTTFVKMLAGQIKPTAGEKEFDVKVSYKPQYIEPKFKGTVKQLFEKELGKELKDFIQADVIQPLNIRPLWENSVGTLSGGELQRVAIALCLAREADIYLIDEPSAYLDSNQRIETAKVIRRTIENRGKSAMIVEHDVYFIDIVADSIMAFGGEPSVTGNGEGPFSMREGMNRFLASVNITFRRDNDTNRPRINKFGSKLDRQQKESGEYYYISA
jgi:ATP-binding cassette subfamily E protein 1